MTSQVSRNRQNGKKYEGELVKLLRENDVPARLGRSNEEGDVILPELNVIIEAKSTNDDIFSILKNEKRKDQFRRLHLSPAQIFYAVRFKGEGLNGWRFYSIPEKPIILRKNEGYSLKEFLFIVSEKKNDLREDNHFIDNLLIKTPKSSEIVSIELVRRK